MRTSCALSLALAALFLLSGCTSLAGRPDPQRRWSDDASPAPDRVPWVVGVFQSAGLMSTAVGSGAIIHSCDAHGTFVLTAQHCVSEGPEAGIWIYDWDGTLPEQGLVSRKDELRCYRVRTVFPKPLPETGSESEELLGELTAALSQLTADFAVLQVEAPGVFPAAPVHPSNRPQLPEGSPLELVAVHPEEYPHKHRFQWTAEWPEEVVQSGHSGGSILFEGKVFAIAAAHWRNSRLVAPGGRPTVATMRRQLADEELAFVLTSGACPASKSALPSSEERTPRGE